MTQHPDEPTNTEASVLVELLARVEASITRAQKSSKATPWTEGYACGAVESYSIVAGWMRTLIAQAANPADRTG